MTLVLAIGTRKGLFLARSADGAAWKVEGPQFLMQEVAAVGFVAAPGGGGAPRLLAGVRSEHWGPGVSHSDDLGETWAEAEAGSVVFPDDTETALERVWQLQGDPARPGVVWAGCEPTSLWRSDDAGETFSLVRGLWDHPHRPWAPGFGGAAVHTVVTDPQDDGRVLVAMSSGGVYVTRDGGGTWLPSNKGISAYFLPDPYPEYGQCVHKVAADAAGPAVLYAQNHHGVYRSDDAGATWTSIADGLPSDFGFVMLAHPQRSGTVWVLPLEADGRRVPPGGRLRLHRTRDGGRTWSEVGTDLPDGSWTSVLRDAADVVGTGDDAAPLLTFGTRDGCVWASTDEGTTFVEVATHLPDILSVRAAVVA
ncbi:sialidase family protein [Kineosporia sp. A_224]|uniref:WD40/YVTN/BNR-like repeat-containing protein n=1 Tax=Kineosporia sp. A_224 TaxID=1962180 RepID=UPI000B4C146B|nr:sialidase family protein [Kineosporia sp. A_224]